MVLGACFLVVFKFASFYTDNTVGGTAESDSPRNERSTPRSFILPATPSVALEQERQRSRSPGKPDEVARCVARLRSLGYQIYGNEGLENVKVVEAIFSFQAASRLESTGRLNGATMKVLQCI